MVSFESLHYLKECIGALDPLGFHTFVPSNPVFLERSQCSEQLREWPSFFLISGTLGRCRRAEETSIYPEWDVDELGRIDSLSTQRIGTDTGLDYNLIHIPANFFDNVQPT